MRTTLDERARIDEISHQRQSTEDFVNRITANMNTVASFEILGESIVPGLTTVPAILQGTFVQITNIGQVDNAFFQLAFTATQPFKLSDPKTGVSLNVNLIDSNLEVINLTKSFENPGMRTISFGRIIPRFGTIIAGIQYLIIPKADASTEGAVYEEMGNRGLIQFGATQGAVFDITTTVRQVFIKSIGNPTDVISASAYSVPLTTGPLYQGTYTETDIFGGS